DTRRRIQPKSADGSDMYLGLLPLLQYAYLLHIVLCGRKNLLFAYILMLMPQHSHFPTVQWLRYFPIQLSVTCRTGSIKTNGKLI
ncbi:hypothetical protein, partial [Bacteroides stercorirosoris]|uniref:hypothetical protein n=1 Tax=Bacteroides stercorirosoris TaxID=871324 RepID=UPI0023F7E9B2